jgi:hypothetical protein
MFEIWSEWYAIIHISCIRISSIIWSSLFTHGVIWSFWESQDPWSPIISKDVTVIHILSHKIKEEPPDGWPSIAAISELNFPCPLHSTRLPTGVQHAIQPKIELPFYTYSAWLDYKIQINHYFVPYYIPDTGWTKNRLEKVKTLKRTLFFCDDKSRCRAKKKIYSRKLTIKQKTEGEKIAQRLYHHSFL